MGASYKIGNTTVIDDDIALISPVIFSDTTTQNPLTGYNNLYTRGQRIHTLDNPNAFNTSAGDFFGFSAVAISGNYAIVGAQREDDAGGTESGKVYIYNVTTGALVYTLNNPNAYSTSAGDFFGSPVDISGNYAIVGAPYEDDSGGSSSGKAYIYNVTTGTLIHTLNNPNAFGTSDSDLFGISVAISGNYAVVGAYNEDDAGGTESGKAYIFNVTTGQLLHTLNNPNPVGTSASDFFGYSVGISDRFVVVGAYGEDEASATDSGKVYIFNLIFGNILGTLNNPNAFDTPAFDIFGYSVAISGNYAIVGSYEDDAGGINSGKAYIFNVATAQLLHTLNNPNPVGTSSSDFFGYSVGISGNYAIVGAYGEDETGVTNPGKAYIFNVATGVLVHTLNNPNAYSTSASDFFGGSVAISGNYVIVGAHGEDDAGGTNSGKAYIFAVKDMTLVDVVLQPGAL